MGNCNNTKQSSSSSSANRQQNKLNVQGHGEITETKVTYKILILGDAGVGKTSLAIKWVDGSFQENYIATIGVDFKKKDVVIDNQLIKLQIWDTAGQERYNTIQATYYRGCAGIIVVYDITDADSFQNVQKWIGNIEKNTSPNDDITILLVGNKADLEDERMVKTEDANNFCKNTSCVVDKVFEVSAKSGLNVNNAFMALVEAIHNKKKKK
ncbi:hypothetical protein FDP41_005581 [Naegleria fowleri]|uniref:Uncharacterized protein n=1 Tax=Naegleria fowleri TaxID=5763 RepID=A0A6A5BEW9_NAEFO|nr:uncharacterized protein FDP41_005581 [Naegleria fowleri]KAF0975587.1 hypothetical protein FDP41_005581 [Naegleria fowleri]CAG4710075.1 unnamed protein product [Naegleria fowleri]